MLNKRIKSILVAGLLMMSMTGNVFANETKTVNQEDPSITAGVEASFFDGGMTVDITEGEKVEIGGTSTLHTKYDFVIKWDGNKYDISKVTIKYPEGFDASSPDYNYYKYLNIEIDENKVVTNEDGTKEFTYSYTSFSGLEVKNIEVTYAEKAVEEEPIVAPLESSISHMVLGDEYSLQDGGLKVKIDPSGMLVLKSSLDFNEHYNLLNVFINLKDGSAENVTIDKFTTYGVGDGIEYQLNLASGRINRLDVDGVTICYEYADRTDTDGNGVPDFKDDNAVDPNPGDPEPDPDPDSEEPEIDDPETGDVGIAGLVLAATALSAGIIINNKGKDDEEE